MGRSIRRCTLSRPPFLLSPKSHGLTGSSVSSLLSPYLQKSSENTFLLLHGDFLLWQVRVPGFPYICVCALGSVLYLQSPHRTTVTTSPASSSSIRSQSQSAGSQGSSEWSSLQRLQMIVRAVLNFAYSDIPAPPVPPSLDLKPRLPLRVLHVWREVVHRVHLRAAVRAEGRCHVAFSFVRSGPGDYGFRLSSAERASLHPCRPPLWRIAASGRRIHRQMSAAKEA